MQQERGPRKNKGVRRKRQNLRDFTENMKTKHRHSSMEDNCFWRSMTNNSRNDVSKSLMLSFDELNREVLKKEINLKNEKIDNTLFKKAYFVCQKQKLLSRGVFEEGFMQTLHSFLFDFYEKNFENNFFTRNNNDFDFTKINFFRPWY